MPVTTRGRTCTRKARSRRAPAIPGPVSRAPCTAPSTTDSFTADDNGASGPLVVGATYRAEAWVRTDPSRPAPPGIVLVLRNSAIINGTFVDQESGDSPNVGIDATWQHFETTLAPTKPGTLNIYIYADHAPNACFIFDDVVVRRVN
jgi:hypothetical protein